jgi:hypothetical protein
MRRLIFRTPNASYRAFAFEFKDDKDGSFYIETGSAAQAGGSGGNTQRVSYHATGRINYNGPINTTTYGEPIFGISQSQMLFCAAFADLDELAQVTDARSDDLVLDVMVAANQRLSLYVWITPPDAGPLQADALVITYADWFAIQICPGAAPVANIVHDTNRIAAAAGRFPDQQVGQEKALIFVHQKRTGVKDLLIWWEMADKPRFRVIFSVPMRIPPKLEVTFADPSLEAVQLEPLIRNTATAELRFRVRGRGGFLTEPPAISKLALDAEL